MNIPLFKQTLQEFISSKTNWVGMGMVVVSTYLLLTSKVTFDQWVMAAGMGAGFMGVKDAVSKK